MKKIITLTVFTISLSSFALFEGGDTYDRAERFCGDNEACHGWATTTSAPTWLVEDADAALLQDQLDQLTDDVLSGRHNAKSVEKFANYLNTSTENVVERTQYLYENEGVTIQGLQSF